MAYFTLPTHTIKQKTMFKLNLSLVGTCGVETEQFTLLRLGTDLALVDPGVTYLCRKDAQSPSKSIKKLSLFVLLLQYHAIR